MAAVPAGVIAERRLVTRLMLANAVSPETATSLENLRWVQARRLQRLVNAGVVQEPQPGRYYLEIPALAERMTARRRRVALLVLLIFAMIAAGTYFGYKSLVFY